MKRFNLTDEEITQCKKFAEEVWKTQKEHRSGGSIIRTQNQMMNDIQLGKVGEIIVKKFLFEEYGITINLDFDVYPRGKWDDGDFILNDKKFSIKSSKSYAKWILLESEDIKRGYLFDYYIFVSVDKNLGGGEVRGYATKNEVLNFQQLKKGTYLPDVKPTPTSILDADNHARKIEYLNQNWSDLFERNSSLPKMY